MKPRGKKNKMRPQRRSDLGQRGLHDLWRRGNTAAIRRLGRARHPAREDENWHASRRRCGSCPRCAPVGMHIAAGKYDYSLPYFRRMLDADAVEIYPFDACAVSLASRWRWRCGAPRVLACWRLLRRCKRQLTLDVDCAVITCDVRLPIGGGNEPDGISWERATATPEWRIVER